MAAEARDAERGEQRERDVTPARDLGVRERAPDGERERRARERGDDRSREIAGGDARARAAARDVEHAPRHAARESDAGRGDRPLERGRDADGTGRARRGDDGARRSRARARGAMKACYSCVAMSFASGRQ